MEINDFMDEFDILLNKYNIDDIILVNFDDDEMGYRQLVKITNTNEAKYLVMSFSGKNKTLCPCCADKDNKMLI